MRYFFHVRNQTSYTRDDIGVELPGLIAARDHAARAVGEILTTDLHQGNSGPVFHVEVEDAAARIMTVHVSAKVEAES